MSPMILSGLPMNFILYEKDYGLAIARLHNERYEVIALNSNKRHSQTPESYPFPYILWSKCVVYSNCDVLLVCAHTKDLGEHRVFKRTKGAVDSKSQEISAGLPSENNGLCVNAILQ